MAWNGSRCATDQPRKVESPRVAKCGAALRPVASAKGRKPLRSVLVVLVVGIVAVVAWRLVSSGHDRSQEYQTPQADVSEKKQPTSFSKGVHDISGRAFGSTSDAISCNDVNTEAAIAAAAEKARQKKWRDKFAKHRSIFTNASDQVLGMIANTPPGRDMPPMPISKSIDHDFERSLNAPIIINDDDSDEVKAVKQAVMQLRLEVQAIKEAEGLSVYDILTQHQDLMRENAKLRIDAHKEAIEIYKSGDEEGAKIYVEKINEKLVKLGAEPIRMPGEQNQELRQHIRNRLDAMRSGRNTMGK